MAQVPATDFPYARPLDGGSPKRKSRVCMGCVYDEALAMDAKRDERLAQRATWRDEDGVLVRRCYQCTHVWPLTEGFYRHNLAAKTLERTYGYLCKKCRPVRDGDYERWIRNHPKLGDEFRRRDAERRRRYRRNHPEAVARRNARYRERLKADGERYARHLESARLRYRLKAMSEGREIAYRGKPSGPRPSTGVAPYTPPAEVTVLVPARQLAAACDATVARWKAFGYEDAMARLFAPMTPEAAQRALYAWRTGEREHVELETACSILLSVGLNHWDVWNEGTVRRWTYRFTRKKKVRGRWMRVRVWHAGDLGPDLEELERVRFAFEGAREEVAAA